MFFLRTPAFLRRRRLRRFDLSLWQECAPTGHVVPDADRTTDSAGRSRHHPGSWYELLPSSAPPLAACLLDGAVIVTVM